jgi:Holliday junction resolvase
LARRVDKNQAEIVDALRRAGCSVTIASNMGNGFPDLCVGRMGYTYLIEVKSKRYRTSTNVPFTKDEVEWHREWKGQVGVAFCVEDALEIVGLL